MPSAKHHAYEPGSPASSRLNALVAHFTDAWRHGQQPAIDAFVPSDADDLFRRAALIELVHAELALRAAAGEPVSAETYFRRYPQLERDPDVAVDLLLAVKDLRGQPRLAPPPVSAAEATTATLPPAPLPVPSPAPPAAAPDADMSPCKVVLEVVAGPHSGTRLEFDRHATCVVGRSRRAPLPLPNDRHFSRHHFLLEFQPPLAFLRDLDSRNGTLVNGIKVKQVHLADGDVISGGKTRIRLSVPTGFESPTGTVVAHLPAGLKTSVPSVNKSALSTATYHPPATPGTSSGLPVVPGYLLVRSLGRGALGEVYEGCRLANGTKVALKRIALHAAVRAEDVKAFLHDAALLGELDHPRLARLCEAFTAGGCLCCAAEYVETLDLPQLLGSLPPEGRQRTACGIACQTLEALKYAHGRGFVHREIKPSNLLVTRTERKVRTKLADFGLARHFENAGLGGLVRVGDLGGALPFLAPEQVLDCCDVQPAADLYGVGATLYHLLTGQTPHVFTAGRDPYAVVLEDPIVPLGRHCPWLPPGLMDIVHRALGKRPQDRFASAGEMRHQLLPFARGEKMGG